MTRGQLVRKGRERQVKVCRTPALARSPMKLGVCRKVYVTKPKKPHSAKRKVAKIVLKGSGRSVIVALPGLGHELQKFSKIYVRGGRVRDLPGVHYKAIRGLGDFTMKERIVRGQRRSHYGLPTKNI